MKLQPTSARTHATKTLPAALAALALAHCGGGGAPSRAQVSEARVGVDAAVTAVGHARAAWSLLNAMPEIPCGAPPSELVAEAVERLRAQSACASVSQRLEGGADVVTVTFPAGGCPLAGRTVTGTATFRYDGGADTLELAADLRGASVDGAPLPAEAGYGGCGEGRRYWVRASGPLGGEAGAAYRVDARVTQIAGAPIFGSTQLVLDATGEVSRPAGTDRLTVTDLHYDVGDLLPTAGTLRIETASGSSVAATFHGDTPVVGSVEVAIDAHDPVSIPIVH